jgi:hypothetical protein
MLGVMWRALCLCELAFVISLTLILPEAVQAQVASSCAGFEVNKPELADWLREFYAKHAQPILGAEQRLSNGVAWRVVIDGATRLAAPRITWMSDRQAMQKANRLFDAAQACAMVTYYGMAGSWFDIAKEIDSRGDLVPLNMPRHQFIWQPTDLVALTYASPGLVSYFEVQVEEGQGRNYPRLIGRVLDLKRDEVVSVSTCGTNDGDFSFPANWQFHFGDFLEVCDAEVHAKFLALWDSKVASALEIIARKGLRTCRADQEDDSPGNRYFTLYLTPSGLAVHTGNAWPYSIRQCMMEKSPFNPIIIPWRELEPFMKPGRWRDELVGRR